MAEPSRTQIQMMLVQQSGPNALPLSILNEASFLPFLRTVEQLAVDERLAPVVVYWSRHSAVRLLPPGGRYRELLRDAFCVSIFSGDIEGPPEEWCFLIESRGLCLIVHGQQAIESEEKFQCCGSMDPQIVRQVFSRLLPNWQSLNLADSNMLEDARVNLGPCGSAPPYVQRIRSAWPIVKAPIQQNLILQPTDLNASKDEAFQRDISALFTDPNNKIQPIATDPSSPGGGSGSKLVMPVGHHGRKPGILDAAAAASAIAGYSGAIAASSGLSAHEQALAAASVIPSEEFETAATVPLGEPKIRRKKDKRADDVSVANELLPSEDPNSAALPLAAQVIISDIIGQLRHANELSSVLQFAIESLTKVTGADRGLIWQVVGDQLSVTNEYATTGHTCFAGNQLSSNESATIVLDFIQRFPDESGAGVIPIEDTMKDTNLHKNSPTLSSLIELGDARARLMVQLRSRGVFAGFLELQQCGKTREWRPQEASILQSVAEMLSVVVQQSVDQSKIEMVAREMKLINEIASLFRESRGQTSQESLVKSLMLVAEHMGFVHSQIYLFDADESVLRPQIHDGNEKGDVPLTKKEDPFVAVFESGRGKTVNAEYTRRGDPFFGHDMALVLPLVSEGERLGVIGLWQRLPNRPEFRPQDRELGLTIAGHLSNVIRADQAITQIRADQARAALINRVSNEIRQSLKEADQILETLVDSVHEYFGLGLSVVSLYDSQTEQFTKSKTAGDLDLFADHTDGAKKPRRDRRDKGKDTKAITANDLSHAVDGELVDTGDQGKTTQKAEDLEATIANNQLGELASEAAKKDESVQTSTELNAVGTTASNGHNGNHGVAVAENPASDGVSMSRSTGADQTAGDGKESNGGSASHNGGGTNGGGADGGGSPVNTLDDLAALEAEGSGDDFSDLERNFGEQLMLPMLGELKQGRTIFLNAKDVAKSENLKNMKIPDSFKSATLVPLIHAGNFKAGLCMVSSERTTALPEKDMKMVADLSDRVAVVISHAELFARVEQQAVTDTLSGLFNRRYFTEQLAKEADRFQRFGHPFSCIVIDLDYFKKINDTLGHHMGDVAIKQTANVLRRNTRDVDTVARFGGEEFAVLLPETDPVHAKLVADRICSAIRENNIEGIGNITASVGVATFPFDAQDLDGFVKLADQAMYLAKHRGRNQVCTASEDYLPTVVDGVAPTMHVDRLPPAPKTEEVVGWDLSIVADKGILGVFAEIVKAIEKKDGYGEDRSPRAYGYASRIAQALHLTREEAEIISLGAVMSVLGKISIPEDVLKKNGPLTPDELDLMKRAPVIGARILEPTKLLYRVSQILESHHENWDGSGYPKGLKENEILPGSRIIAIVDAYIAMTTDRPYRKSMTKEEAIKILLERAGKEWDPRLVKTFTSILQKEPPPPKGIKG